MADRFFPFEVDRRWSPMFTALRLKDSDGVTLTDDGMLRASLGFARLETPVDNIDHTDISGPHRWYTAVGVRLSFADDGLTFGTNHRRGVCIGFVERVPKVIGFRPHSALWVSVADCDGLVAAIGR